MIVKCKKPEDVDAANELQKQMEGLAIDDPKEETKIAEVDEEGPIMGFFAVQPISECPHCIPIENIAPLAEFSELTITTPCKDCGHTKENWICLKCKVIGCSRYVKSHMVAHNDECKHPIALSFADFSYWCYECDSYVKSKHLDHVKHFYVQKFGSEEASHVAEFMGIKDSKAT